VTLYAGRIKNWRLGAAWDNVLASQYFTKHTDSTLFRTGSLRHVQPPSRRLHQHENMGYLSDFQPLPLASRTLKEKYLVGAEKYLVSAKLIAYLKWLMNVAAFKDCGNVDHLLYYNKQVAFLNHLNNQLWRELLYTALDAWYSKFSGKPSKKQKGRFSCGTWVDFFTNIDDFFDPLADDDEPHPAGVALDVAGTRSCQAASPLPQRQGLRRPQQCRRRTRLKIKAPASDLGWLCIAAERARGEARIQHSRRAGAQHGRVQCTVL